MPSVQLSTFLLFCPIKIDLIDWGFIYQKHTDSPTFPHLGKVGQIYGNIMVEWLAFVVVFHFLYSS
jgi:hypothetical protein